MKPLARKSALGIVVLGLLLALWLLTSNQPPRQVTLSNGTELSFRGVTVGTNLFFPGGAWDKLVYHITPAKGLSIGPLRLGPVTPMSDIWRRSDGSIAFSNKLVVWLGHGGTVAKPPLPVPEDKWHSVLRATLADESGEEWDMRVGIGHLRPVTGAKVKQVSRWAFSSFPRRGKILRFRLKEHVHSNEWNTLADFTFSNPQRGPHPEWTSANLPVTQQNGDLTASLVELVSGVKALPYKQGTRPFTRAAFEVKQNGQATELWIPDQIHALDATGNEPWYPMASTGATNGTVFFEMQGVHLSPSEVWRLKLRFGRTWDPALNPLWTSPELETFNGRLTETNFVTSFLSRNLALECTHDPFRNTIRLKLSPLPQHYRGGHLQIVDDQNRRVEYASGGFEDAGCDAQWTIPSDAKWVRVTFGLVETRELEFVARPVRE